MKLKIKKAMMAKSVKKEDPYRPTISFDEKQLSGIKGLSVDQEVKIEVTAKVLNTGRSRWADGKPLTAEFEISGGKVETEKEDEPKNTIEARNQLIKKASK